jgi:AraC-like DNA-binding protein
MAGYEDSGAFSKAFKRETGISPGKYRLMRT